MRLLLRSNKSIARLERRLGAKRVVEEELLDRVALLEAQLNQHTRRTRRTRLIGFIIFILVLSTWLSRQPRLYQRLRIGVGAYLRRVDQALEICKSLRTRSSTLNRVLR